jgi:dipeptidase E
MMRLADQRSDSFELSSDSVISDALITHVNDNFRVVESPGQALHCDPVSGEAVYAKILTTGSGNGIHIPFIFDKLIALTGKERPNVVYIGTPFFDREGRYETGTKSFRNIKCRVKRLMVAEECTTPSEEEMRRIVVNWADLIMISGGNSLFAMLRWQSIGLDLLLREAALKGKVLCGGSAGCGCYFDSMQTDSLKPEACKLGELVLAELTNEERLNWSFVRITCLGFINAFCVPHIDTVGTNNIARVDTAKKMLLEAHMRVESDPDSRPIFGFGVDENAAIIYEGGKLKIFSGGLRKSGVGDATCHILFVNNMNEVICVPIAPNTGEALTMDEWIDRAMRSVMALQSPLDLIVSEGVSNACHRRGCSDAIDFMTLSETPTSAMERTLSLRSDPYADEQHPVEVEFRSPLSLRSEFPDPNFKLLEPQNDKDFGSLPTSRPPLHSLHCPESPFLLNENVLVQTPNSIESIEKPDLFEEDDIAAANPSDVSTGLYHHGRVKSQSMDSFVDMFESVREIPGMTIV